MCTRFLLLFCSLQGLDDHLARACNLDLLFSCATGDLAAMLASSSLPSAALHLAQQLDRSNDPGAASKVRYHHLAM